MGTDVKSNGSTRPPLKVDETAQHQPGWVVSAAGWIGRRRAWALLVVTSFVLTAAGLGVGAGMLARANSGDGACSVPTSPGEPPSNLVVSDAPSSIVANLGFGRGLAAVNGGTFTAGWAEQGTATANLALPEQIGLTSLSTAKSSIAALKSVNGVATRVGQTSIYEIHLCVDTTQAASGDYRGQIIFTSSKVTSQGAISTEVTLQNVLLPFLFGLIPIWALLGFSYACTLFLRRAKPTLTSAEWEEQFKASAFSVNGALALLLALGAAFGAWRTACFGNTTWGSDWPDVLVALVALMGAAAGATTPALALSSQEAGAGAPAPDLQKAAAEPGAQPGPSDSPKIPPGMPATGTRTAPAASPPAQSGTPAESVEDPLAATTSTEARGDGSGPGDGSEETAEGAGHGAAHDPEGSSARS
jgi:hypothetical protein